MSRQVALRYISLAELRLKQLDPDSLADAETCLWKAMEIVREERMSPQPIGVVLARALRAIPGASDHLAVRQVEPGAGGINFTERKG